MRACTGIPSGHQRISHKSQCATGDTGNYMGMIPGGRGSIRAIVAEVAYAHLYVFSFQKNISAHHLGVCTGGPEEHTAEQGEFE